MKTEKIDAIIFDLGGVIINLDYNRTSQAFEELGLSNFKEVYSQFAQNSLFDDFETGKISAPHFINKLLPILPKSTSPNQVVAAWNAMILDFPKQKIALLSELKNKYRVFLLSNTNEIHMVKVKREWKKVSEYPMEDYFETIFLSHEMGMRKPDPEIFSTVCEREGLNPAKTLFIDDSPQHIEGAKSVGLNTIHLINPEDLYIVFS
jgi:putative hydrolase of the HAD superfamily